MAIELTGKIILLLNPQSGTSARGEWKKQEFVIETNDQYPKKICISAWNERAAMVSQMPVGTPVRVSVNIESREYNGKWYTDVRVWDIKVDQPGQGQTIDPPFSGEYSDMPPQSGSQTYASTSDNTVPLPDAEDELPF
jgi:hypothetical protein